MVSSYTFVNHFKIMLRNHLISAPSKLNKSDIYIKPNLSQRFHCPLPICIIWFKFNAICQTRVNPTRQAFQHQHTHACERTHTQLSRQWASCSPRQTQLNWFSGQLQNLFSSTLQATSQAGCQAGSWHQLALLSLNLVRGGDLIGFLLCSLSLQLLRKPTCLC